MGLKVLISLLVSLTLKVSVSGFVLSFPDANGNVSNVTRDGKFGSWTNPSRILYHINGSYNDEQQNLITAAMMVIAFDMNLCIQFDKYNPETDAGQDFLYISDTLNDGTTPPTCVTFVGRLLRAEGEGQKLVMHNGPFGCIRSVREVMHVLVNALGLRNEYRRPDRDQYIKVFPENIQPELSSLLTAYPINDVTFAGNPFDYQSVTMIPKASKWAKPNTVIWDKPDGSNVVHLDRLSYWDCAGLSRIYPQCSALRCRDPYAVDVPVAAMVAAAPATTASSIIANVETTTVLQMQLPNATQSTLNFTETPVPTSNSTVEPEADAASNDIAGVVNSQSQPVMTSRQPRLLFFDETTDTTVTKTPITQAVTVLAVVPENATIIIPKALLIPAEVLNASTQSPNVLPTTSNSLQLQQLDSTISNTTTVSPSFNEVMTSTIASPTSTIVPLILVDVSTAESAAIVSNGTLLPLSNGAGIFPVNGTLPSNVTQTSEWIAPESRDIALPAAIVEGAVRPVDWSLPVENATTAATVLLANNLPSVALVNGSEIASTMVSATTTSGTGITVGNTELSSTPASTRETTPVVGSMSVGAEKVRSNLSGVLKANDSEMISTSIAPTLATSATAGSSSVLTTTPAVVVTFQETTSQTTQETSTTTDSPFHIRLLGPESAPAVLNSTAVNVTETTAATTSAAASATNITVLLPNATVEVSAARPASVVVNIDAPTNATVVPITVTTVATAGMGGLTLEGLPVTLAVAVDIISSTASSPESNSTVGVSVNATMA